MSSKVEELLQEINDTLEDTANSLNPCFHRDFIGLDDVLDSLISAVHAEGVAEGVEQERERIREEGTLVYDKEAAGDILEIDAGKASYMVPASVLAPTKEPYVERLRNSVTDEINGEDVDPTPD